MNKLLSVVLAIILIVSNTFILSSALNEQDNLIYFDENISASVGEIKKIPIYILNNSGVMGFKLIFRYNAEILKPISVERGDVISSGMFNDNIDVDSGNEFYVIWSDNNNCSKDGVLFYVNFMVLQTNENETSVELSFSQDDTFNENWEDVHFLCNDLLICISGQSSSGTDDPITDPIDSENPIIYSDITACDIGETTIPVYIKNNCGIMGYKLVVNYDSEIVEPLDVGCSGTMNGSFDSNIGMKTGTFSIVWNNTENNNENGLLFNLLLNIKSTDETVITISYSEDDTFNESWDPVELSFKNILLNHRNIVAPEATVDYVGRMIYGLSSGMDTIDNLIFANDNAKLLFQKNNKYFGTGSKVLVYNNNEDLIEEFVTIIFGDVNGDGWYDGQDAVTVSMIAGGMLTREQVGEAVWMAADCNHDGVIDQADVELLNQAGVLLSNVDQTKSTDELLETSAEYVEYLNLIDQQTDADSDEAPEDNTEENQDSSELSLWNIIVKYFIALIKKIASVIKVF